MTETNLIPMGALSVIGKVEGYARNTVSSMEIMLSIPLRNAELLHRNDDALKQARVCMEDVLVASQGVGNNHRPGLKNCS